MLLIAFVVGAAFLQASVSNALRLIHARSTAPLLSVVSNYAVAFLVALGYRLLAGPTGPGIGVAAAVGLPGGVFYAIALLAIIRSMGQRGLALTVAFAGLGQLVPSLVAVLLGDALGWVAGIGLLVAATALPLLSLATASGTAIRERPHLGLAGALVVLQGGAMSANLLASRLVPPSHFSTYLVLLFGSALTVSAVLWRHNPGQGTSADVRRGALFGALNITTTFVIVSAAAAVSGALFFAGMSMTALLMTTAVAVLWWRERLQAFGWVGLCLAGVALVLMNL